MDRQRGVDKNVYLCICLCKCEARCLSGSCVRGGMGTKADKRGYEVERAGRLREEVSM